MLLGKAVKEFVSRDRAPCLHVLKTSSHAFDGLLIVLTLPLSVVAEGVIEGISGTLPTPAGVLLELREAFGFER